MSPRVRRVALPLAEWRELGARRRRQVARLARRGQQHPDRYVAAVARAWAAELSRTTGPPRRLRDRTAGAGLAALLAAALHGVPVLPGGSEWRERRLARRVLSAAPRREPGPDGAAEHGP